MSLDEITDLSTLYEGIDVEAKEAQGRDGQGAVPKSVWDTYSAFANTYGGIIILGAQEDETDGHLGPVGIGDPEKVKREFCATLQNPQKVNRNILRERHFKIVQQQGCRILMIEVPRAKREERPIYLGPDPYKGTYKRLDDGDFLCSRDEVQRMFAEASPHPLSDRTLEGTSIDDLEPSTIKRFRLRFRDVKPEHPFLDGSDEEMLEQLQVLREGPHGEEGCVTVSGLVMFGKLPKIERHLPQYFLDYREYLGDPNRWSHRICTDGTWSGNLYDFYTQVIRRLHRDLDVPFRLDEESRRVDETVVHEALREALANTLSHADHETRGSILIERHYDRYLFSNPGRLRLPVQDVMRGGESDPRNPTIHKMFLLLGVAERAGSGVPEILKAWDTQHWRRPLLVEELEPVERTKLTLHMASLLPDEAVKEVERLIGDHAFASLTHAQRIILVTTCVEQDVDHGRLSQLLDMHSRDLTLALQKLVERDYLIRHGHNRWSTYELNTGKAFEDAPLFHQRSHHSEQSSHHSEQSSHYSAQSSPQSSHYSEQSSHYSEQSSHQSADTNDWEALKAIAFAITRGRGWVNQDDMKRAIVQMCNEKALSASELAALLGRSENTIKNNYLPGLINEGRLRYAEKSPTHPAQRYVTPDALDADSEE